MKTFLVTLVAVAAAATGALAVPATASASAGTVNRVAVAPTARAAVSYSTQAFKATNRQRFHNSHKRLKTSSCLTRYAQAQAVAMASSHTMYHQAMAPIQAGCKAGWVGENVAFGFPSGRQTVNSGWMHSPEHRANIMDRHYRQMGIAAAQATDGTWYISQVFGRAL